MKHQNNILIVDDDPRYLRLIEINLITEGYQVKTSMNGQDAVEQVAAEQPNLLLMDVMMPIMDGFTATERIREFSNVPIIILTAKGEEHDRVRGLDVGADDYIVKPFSPRALVARVRALLRRAQGGVKPAEVIRVGMLEIDPARHTAVLEGQSLQLTPSEFDLLVVLARHPGHTLTRQQLMEDLYPGAASAIDRSVDSHIKNLRRKIESASNTLLIETVYGVGYRFVEGQNA